MKKWFVILISLLFLISGCTSTSQQSTDKPSEVQTDEQVGVNEEQISDNETDGETTGPFLEYRPEVGMKKSFSDGSDIVMTEEVVAMTDKYVQILLMIGDSNTTQVFQWTDKEVILVFEEVGLENPKENILGTFEPNMNEVVLNENNQTNWKLVEKDGTVTVPYGRFDNVYTIKKVTDEVVNEDTIYTRYYAPEVGLIKETFELTGENGYTGETNLSNID